MTKPATRWMMAACLLALVLGVIARIAAPLMPGLPPSTTRADAVLGMTTEPLTPAIGARMRLPETVSGLVVTSLKPMSVADRAGIETGDVVERAGNAPLHSRRDLAAALAHPPHTGLRLTVFHHDTERHIALLSTHG